MEQAQGVDTDKNSTNALLDGSAAGAFYRIIGYVSGEELIYPNDAILCPPTFK